MKVPHVEEQYQTWDEVGPRITQLRAAGYPVASWPGPARIRCDHSSRSPKCPRTSGIAQRLRSTASAESGYARETMAKEQRLVKHREQVVADAIEQAIRVALPIGYTGQMVVKVFVADGRVKVEVEAAE